jgi:hypothetical protein
VIHKNAPGAINAIAFTVAPTNPSVGVTKGEFLPSALAELTTSRVGAAKDEFILLAMVNTSFPQAQALIVVRANSMPA